MGLGYRPLPPRTASSIHRPSVSQTLAWRWGLAPRSQVRAERYCPHDSDCNRIVCFVGTNSLSALRWNSNGGYVASSLRQSCLILSVSNTTLYNKQNFVQQATSILNAAAPRWLVWWFQTWSVLRSSEMALNPNYEAIGKAFTTQYYQVLFLTSWGFMNLAGKMYD